MCRIPDLGTPATRRRTLAFAVASAAALHSGPTTGKQKSCKKQARKKVDAAGTRMRDECLTYYDARCAESSDPEACRAALAECCGHLEAGNFTEHVTCIYQSR